MRVRERERELCAPREAKNKGRVARYYELVKLASSGRKAGPALSLDQVRWKLLEARRNFQRFWKHTRSVWGSALRGFIRQVRPTPFDQGLV